MGLERRLKVLDGHTEEDWVAGAVTVAFASTDLKTVDQHFGAAESFVLYAVTPERSRMLEVVQFGQLKMDGNEDKLMAKMEALTGCAAVYVQAIGSSAVARLAQEGIQPVKVAPKTPIEGLLGALQDEFRDGPSAWLARAVDRHKNPDRFDAMEAEGWEE